MIRVLTSVVAAVCPLITAPPSAVGQTFHSLSGGLSFQSKAWAFDSYGRGFALQASIGRQFASWTSLRLNAQVNSFNDYRPPHVGYLCFDPAVACNWGGSQIAAGVASVGVDWLVRMLGPSEPPIYVMLGVGAYYLYHDAAEGPQVSSAVRPGLSVGAGYALPITGKSRLFVEGRYERLMNARGPLVEMTAL